MVKQHIKRIIVCAIIGAALGAGIYMFSPKIYEGSAQILIATTDTSSQGTNPEVASILSTGVSENVGTEIAILRSRGIFLTALKNVSDSRGDLSLMNRDYYERIYKMYDVTGSRDSRAAEIVVKAFDPQLAADLANEITYAYNEKRRDSSKESISEAQALMETQIDIARKDLGKAEADLRDFKQNAKIVDLNSKATQLVAYQSTLLQQVDSTSADLKVSEATIAAMRKQLGNLPDLETTGHTEAQTPLQAKLNEDLANYETQRTSLLRNYTENSIRVKEVDDLIARTKQKIVEAQKDQWTQTSRTLVKGAVKKQFQDSLVTSQVSNASLRRRLSTLQSALAEVNRQINEVPANETKLAELMRDREIYDAKYRNIRAAIEDLRYKGNAGMRQARTLYRAQPQTIPIAPDLTKLVLICTVGGVIVGFLYSVARESLRSTAQTSVELSQLLGLPVSATMPQLPLKLQKQIYKSLPTAAFKPFESFKFMAFSMLFSQNNPPKRVLFTSIGGSVGCTTSAAQFAIAAARTGKPTIIMDCDLRHMTLTKMFNMENKTGVREVINRMIIGTDNAQIALPTEHELLSIVPSGSQGGEGITDVPVGALSAFLDTLQSQTGAIVIDAPPCDVVSDALRFAPYVDSVCLVASARSSKYPNIALAIELLKRAGAKEVRLVMTFASPEEEAFSRKSLYVVR
jgi:uncharacterized protein involved in exopolysaccharide biosynthesis/Mrp family chromosome partitioning ATPase